LKSYSLQEFWERKVTTSQMDGNHYTMTKQTIYNWAVQFGTGCLARIACNCYFIINNNEIYLQNSDCCDIITSVFHLPATYLIISLFPTTKNARFANLYNFLYLFLSPFFHFILICSPFHLEKLIFSCCIVQQL
jgi:hypothetical protein